MTLMDQIIHQLQPVTIIPDIIWNVLDFVKTKKYYILCKQTEKLVKV